MFETLGPAPRHHRGRERLTPVDEALQGARRSSTNDIQDKGRAILETVEAREPRRDPAARPPVPLDPGLNHGDPRGVPGRSATRSCRMRSIPKDARVPRPLLQGGARERARSKSPLDINRRVAGELLGQQRAEGVGREVRRAPPERRRASISRASSAATTRRPTASSTRSSSSRQDALRGAARHRREQARRLDQDPRQDVRARAEAPRGAPRGLEQAEGTSSSTRSTRSASSCSSSRRSSSATRACRTPRSIAQIEALRAKLAGVRAARRPPDGARARPKGIVQLGKKTQGRDDRPGRRRPTRTSAAE